MRVIETLEWCFKPSASFRLVLVTEECFSLTVVVFDEVVLETVDDEL